MYPLVGYGETGIQSSNWQAKIVQLPAIIASSACAGIENNMQKGEYFELEPPVIF